METSGSLNENDAGDVLQLTDLHYSESNAARTLQISYQAESQYFYADYRFAFENAARYTQRLQQTYENQIAALSAKHKMAEEQNQHLVQLVQQREEYIALQQYKMKALQEDYMRSNQSVQFFMNYTRQNEQTADEMRELREANYMLATYVAELEQKARYSVYETSSANQACQSTYEYYESLMQAAQARESAFQTQIEQYAVYIAALAPLAQKQCAFEAERVANLKAMVAVFERIEQFLTYLRDESVVNLFMRHFRALDGAVERVYQQIFKIECAALQARDRRVARDAAVADDAKQRYALAELQKQQIEHFNALLGSYQQALAQVERYNESMARQIAQWESSCRALTQDNQRGERERSDLEARIVSLQQQMCCLTEQNEQLRAELRKRVQSALQ